ncbi:hypothetical protein PINS_up020626 [Pythium insidiosum]|nr:hypothetical protein PINS_up020626 [Pythium insidiosum]
MSRSILEDLITFTCLLCVSTARFATATASFDLYVVTDVRMVQAPSRDAALDLCQRDGLSVTTGVDWTNGVHLCQRRMKIHDVKLDQQVVTQLAVCTSTTSCPSGSTLLHSPRPNVVVCVSTGEASTWIASGNYVSDVSVTQERNYNNDDMALGWTTSPIKLKDEVKPLSRGVFLSVRHPVRAIVAIRLLSNVRHADRAVACAGSLGTSWRSAGLGYLDGDNDTIAVLCVELEDLDETTARRPHLVDVAVIASKHMCKDGFSTRTELSTRLALCTKWAQVSIARSFVVDLDLHRVDAELEDADPLTKPEFLPGRFEFAGPLDLNGDRPLLPPVYLLKRRSRWLDTSAVTSNPSRRPPITAVVDAADANRLTFKVLQLADLHYTGDAARRCNSPPPSIVDCREHTMEALVNALLDVEKPDFVALTGDNVETTGPSFRLRAMETATRAMEMRRIPFAMVFGNHDDDNGFSREQLVAIAMDKPFSYTERGPHTVDGVGNYEISVQAPRDGAWGKRGIDVFRMYFLDSHGYTNRTRFPHVRSRYDWIKPSQIAFYRALASAHIAANNSVPAILFFHIPLVEYAAVAASTSVYHRSGGGGSRWESVTSSDVNSNLLSTLVDMGDVKATFAGHDHLNDDCRAREGVQLCYGGSVGLTRAYGSSAVARRARVIEWAWSDGRRSLRTWKRLLTDPSQRHDEHELYED